MLYRTLKRMIQRRQVAGMAQKLDIFFAADKLTEAEYTELTALLCPPPGDASAPVKDRLAGNARGSFARTLVVIVTRSPSPATR